jgi:hypothetical protein
MNVRKTLIDVLGSKANKAIGLAALTLAASMASTSASAVIRELQAVPTTWRLQYYAVTPYRTTASASVFFTGITATCAGQFQGVSITNANDIKRFYDTMMAAKLAKAKITLYYDDVTCVVDSFGLAEQAP